PQSAISNHCPLPTADCPLRLGLRLIRGLPEAAAQQIVAARMGTGSFCGVRGAKSACPHSTPFTSITDLTQRTKLGRGVIKRLAEADAFNSLALTRRADLWQALDQAPSVEALPLFAALKAADSETPDLPQLTPQQEV